MAAQTPGRKLELLDNCSSHGKAEKLPTLDPVEAIFRPSNSITRLQPMDASIVAAIKLRYRAKQYEGALYLSDKGIDNIYNIDLLCTMWWIKHVWDFFPMSVIPNIKKHTGVLNKGRHFQAFTVAPENHLMEEEGNVDALVSQLATPVTRTHLDTILSAKDNVAHTETFLKRCWWRLQWKIMSTSLIVMVKVEVTASHLCLFWSNLEL